MVIVAYGDKIAHASTPMRRLESLFETAQGIPGQCQQQFQAALVELVAQQQKELIGKAKEAYDNAVKAQKNGDWKAYGEHLDELSGYLDQLADRKLGLNFLLCDIRRCYDKFSIWKDVSTIPAEEHGIEEVAKVLAKSRG